MNQRIYNFRLSDEGLKDLLKRGYYAEDKNKYLGSRGHTMLSITMDQAQKIYTLALAGRVNAFTIEQFQDVVNEIIASEKDQVVVDCKELLSISSIGLGLLAKLARHCKGRVILRNVRKSIHSLLDMSGLNRILIVKDSIVH